MDKFLSDENIYLTSMRSMFFKGKTALKQVDLCLTWEQGGKRLTL